MHGGNAGIDQGLYEEAVYEESEQLLTREVYATAPKTTHGLRVENYHDGHKHPRVP
jgi:hypothetical protein